MILESGSFGWRPFVGYARRFSKFLKPALAITPNTYVLLRINETGEKHMVLEKRNISAFVVRKSRKKSKNVEIICVFVKKIVPDIYIKDSQGKMLYYDRLYIGSDFVMIELYNFPHDENIKIEYNAAP